MNCPKCGGKSKIYDSRTTSYGKWRREKCEFCKHTFSTVEITMSEYGYLKKLKDKYELILRAAKKLENIFDV